MDKHSAGILPCRRESRGPVLAIRTETRLHTGPQPVIATWKALRDV